MSNDLFLLSETLVNLKAYGVEEVTIVGQESSAQHIDGGICKELVINFIKVPSLEFVGTSYYLWLARDTLLADDCYIIESHFCIDHQVLCGLALTEFPNVAVIGRSMRSLNGGKNQSFKNRSITLPRTNSTARAGGASSSRMAAVLRLSVGALTSAIVPALNEVIGSGAVGASITDFVAYLVERRGVHIVTMCGDDLRRSKKLLRAKTACPSSAPA
ncbi:hypothetical protein RFM26_31300 [Mesorhizobium sp. VK23B]|uniref:Uncharacterized protein n=1 Tax=Mesorhizobium dulcispinae TaxID=3072316 RepID=A0ABU4XSB4_9HYPH|nr:MULTISPECIES: hypothetical protein [unclassified Mesorhizobium]MDX8470167.1 hypothetical protein [Mesorhizobium sp. VK23B]MDX8476557.1 hypothetical protein [Mesorhizobium sp. VK23A]